MTAPVEQTETKPLTLADRMRRDIQGARQPSVSSDIEQPSESVTFSLLPQDIWNGFCSYMLPAELLKLRQVSKYVQNIAVRFGVRYFTMSYAEQVLFAYRYIAADPKTVPDPLTRRVEYEALRDGGEHEAGTLDPQPLIRLETILALPKNPSVDRKPNVAMAAIFKGAAYFVGEVTLMKLLDSLVGSDLTLRAVAAETAMGVFSSCAHVCLLSRSVLGTLFEEWMHAWEVVNRHYLSRFDYPTAQTSWEARMLSAIATQYVIVADPKTDVAAVLLTQMSPIGIPADVPAPLVTPPPAIAEERPPTLSILPADFSNMLHPHGDGSEGLGSLGTTPDEQPLSLPGSSAPGSPMPGSPMESFHRLSTLPRLTSRRSWLTQPAPKTKPRTIPSLQSTLHLWRDRRKEPRFAWVRYSELEPMSEEIVALFKQANAAGDAYGYLPELLVDIDEPSAVEALGISRDLIAAAPDEDHTPMITPSWRKVADAALAAPRLHVFLSGIEAVERLPEFFLRGRFSNLVTLTISHMDELECIGDNFAVQAPKLESVQIHDNRRLAVIDFNMCSDCNNLRYICLRNLPQLVSIGSSFGHRSQHLRRCELINLPLLQTIGDNFLARTTQMISFRLHDLPSLRVIGKNFLRDCIALGTVELQNLPELRVIDDNFLTVCNRLVRFTLEHMPRLRTLGRGFCSENRRLQTVILRDLPSLEVIRSNFCCQTPALEDMVIRKLPSLAHIGAYFVSYSGVNTVTLTSLPELQTIEDFFCYDCAMVDSVAVHITPKLSSIGSMFCARCDELVLVSIVQTPRLAEIGGAFADQSFHLATVHVSDTVPQRKISQQLDYANENAVSLPPLVNDLQARRFRRDRSNRVGGVAVLLRGERVSSPKPGFFCC